jgi:hypothetical protein
VRDREVTWIEEHSNKRGIPTRRSPASSQHSSES